MLGDTGCLRVLFASGFLVSLLFQIGEGTDGSTEVVFLRKFPSIFLGVSFSTVPKFSI